jgi:hypothetical protein
MIDLIDQSRYQLGRYVQISHGQPAALEALQCGPSTVSEKRYFGAKSIKSLDKI